MSGAASAEARTTRVRTHRLLAVETAVVVAMAVGLSAARSVLVFVAALLTPGGLRAQQATLNGSLAPGHPWVDLGLQLASLARLVLPVAVVLVLVALRGERLQGIGLRADRWRRDAVIGVAAATLIGGIGLGAYLVSYAVGGSVAVIPTTLPPVWWRVPVLVLAAAANAALEEVVLVGYLMRRGGQLGWSPARAVATSAAIRGCYHLYQGLAGLVGNLVMGAFFARYFLRTGRIVPQLVAHTVIDIGAFLGYLLVAGHVSWLPLPVGRG